MAVLDFPNISPDNEDWELEYNTQTFTSKLNGIVQTAEFPGARWAVSMTFPNRQGRSARELQAFLTSLRGRAGRFFYTPSDWQPLGNPSGTGAVATATASGATSVPTDGWDVSITELFVTGDYFEVNGELKKITASVDSDGTGLATLDFMPPLRKDVTGGMQIRYVEPRCQMMLSDDRQAGWAITSGMLYATPISAKEALDL